MKLITKEPIVMQVNNSKTLRLIIFKENLETLLQISGERNANIRLLITDVKK